MGQVFWRVMLDALSWFVKAKQGFKVMGGRGSCRAAQSMCAKRASGSAGASPLRPPDHGLSSDHDVLLSNYFEASANRRATSVQLTTFQNAPM